MPKITKIHVGEIYIRKGKVYLTYEEFKKKNEGAGLSFYTYEGAYIELDNNEYILICIYDSLSCCENFGMLETHCDVEKFIGAEFIKLTYDGKAFDGKVPYLEDGDVKFINIHTSKGVLDFAVYNAHNGYYGHDVFFSVVKDGKLCIEESYI